jgi:hypothetical protein
MTGALLLAVATGGVVLGAVLAARGLGLRDPLEWSVAVGLLIAVEIVVVSLAAGVPGRFEPGGLLAATAALDVALVVAARRSGRRSIAPRVVVTAARRVLTDLEPWQAVLVALAAAALLWRLVLALVLPPFAYDALTYHLTLVASWVQGGRIEPNPYADCCSHYPANAETLSAWPTVFLDHDAFADTPQIALAVLGALAVAGLARFAGAAAAGATTAAALFVLTPIVLTQANTAYNDVAIASMFLVALFFATCLLRPRGAAVREAVETPPVGYAALAGGALGFALGAKANGIVIAFVLGTLVAGLALGAARRRLVSRRRALAVVATFAVTALAIGGYWYARNWVETGNPVWPYRVALLDHDVFAGPNDPEEYLTVPPGGNRAWPVEVARSWYHDLVFWTRRDYSYEQRDGGLGPLWSWLGWGAVAALSLAAARRRPDVLLRLVLPTLAVLALLPYKWWSRFTIPLAALGAIALVVLVERARRGDLRRLLVASILALALAGGARATWTLDPAGRGTALSMPDVVRLALHRERDRTVGTLFFPEYRWLAEVPPRATVLVETEAPSIRFVYPLFGAGLDRRVLQLLPGEERETAEILPRQDDLYVAVERGGAFDGAAARDAALRRIFDERGVRVYRRTATTAAEARALRGGKRYSTA